MAQEMRGSVQHAIAIGGVKVSPTEHLLRLQTFKPFFTT